MLGLFVWYFVSFQLLNLRLHPFHHQRIERQFLFVIDVVVERELKLLQYEHLKHQLDALMQLHRREH